MTACSKKQMKIEWFHLSQHVGALFPARKVTLTKETQEMKTYFKEKVYGILHALSTHCNSDNNSNKEVIASLSTTEVTKCLNTHRKSCKHKKGKPSTFSTFHYVQICHIWIVFIYQCLCTHANILPKLKL